MMAINPRDLSVKAQTELPFGFSTLQVNGDLGVASTEVPLPPASAFPDRRMEFKEFDHVVVSIGSAQAWVGRIGKLERGAGGQITGFYASGYGQDAFKDNPFISTQSRLTTSGIIVQQALEYVGAPVRVAQPGSDGFLDPEILHSPVEFDGMNMAEIVDKITKEGDASGHAWNAYVYAGNRVGVNYLYLKPEVAPPVPDYLYTPRNEVQTWYETFDNCWGAIQTEYTDGETGQPAISVLLTNPDFEPRYEIMRTYRSRGGVMTAAAVDAFQQAFLARSFNPALALQLNFTSTFMTTPQGMPVPPYLVRAGQWVRLPPRVNWDPCDVVIRRTDLDFGQDTLTVYLGQESANISELLSHIKSQAHKLTRGIHPQTGGHSSASKTHA